MILGDLVQANINFDTQNMKDADKRYGLYSDNVILNGTLTTIIDRSGSKYAGVNTITGVNATVFQREEMDEPDTSRIVFWGGSDGDKPEDIAAAPFQVTENGSLYASLGLFTGAIITDSEIHGADIFAARIHGNNKGAYGLAIYDTSQGILFRQGGSDENWDANVVDVFSIRTDGFYVGTNKFIQVDGEYNNGNTVPNVHFYASNLKISEDINTKNLTATSGVIKYMIDEDSWLQMGGSKDFSYVTNSNVYSAIDFGTNGDTFTLSLQNTDRLSITSNLTTMNTNVVKMKQHLYLSDGMHFDQQLDNNQNFVGYDLYIA